MPPFYMGVTVPGGIHVHVLSPFSTCSTSNEHQREEELES